MGLTYRRLLLMFGFAIALAGIALIYPPLALILGGLLIAGMAIEVRR